MESCSTSTGISLVPNLPKHQPQAKQILKLPNIKGENKFTRIFCQSLYSRKYPEVFVPYFPCSVLNDDRFSLLKRDRFFHVYMWRSFGGIIISPPRASCPKCTCNPRLTIITRRSFGEMAPGSSTGWPEPTPVHTLLASKHDSPWSSWRKSELRRNVGPWWQWIPLQPTRAWRRHFLRLK